MMKILKIKMMNNFLLSILLKIKKFLSKVKLIIIFNKLLI